MCMCIEYVLNVRYGRGLVVGMLCKIHTKLIPVPYMKVFFHFIKRIRELVISRGGSKISKEPFIIGSSGWKRPS